MASGREVEKTNKMKSNEIISLTIDELNTWNINALKSYLFIRERKQMDRLTSWWRGNNFKLHL